MTKTVNKLKLLSESWLTHYS